jgi:hypothetical protein
MRTNTQNIPQELGASILRDLHGQRETIMHSKTTLQVRGVLSWRGCVSLA